MKAKNHISFEEAKKFDDAYMVIEEGVDVLLAAPIELVKCDYSILEKLLKDLVWDEGSEILYFKRVSKEWSDKTKADFIVPFQDSLWVNEKFKDIKNDIHNVLIGRKSSIKN